MKEKLLFKIGDKVSRVGSGNCYMAPGDEGIVTSIVSNDAMTVNIITGAHKGEQIGSFKAHYFKLISSSFMSSTIIEKIKLARKAEPEKSFIKAGIMNMDETFTTDGKQLFDRFIYDKFKDDFKKEVEPVIKEMEAEAKK